MAAQQESPEQRRAVFRNHRCPGHAGHTIFKHRNEQQVETDVGQVQYQLQVKCIARIVQADEHTGEDVY